MAAPNIVNVVTITGKTAVQAITTSATAIVTNAADSGKVFKVNALYISNVDGTNNADINVEPPSVEPKKVVNNPNYEYFATFS